MRRLRLPVAVRSQGIDRQGLFLGSVADVKRYTRQHIYSLICICWLGYRHVQVPLPDVFALITIGHDEGEGNDCGHDNGQVYPQPSVTGYVL